VIALSWPGSPPLTDPPHAWTPAELVLYDWRFVPVYPGAATASLLSPRHLYEVMSILNGLFYAAVARLVLGGLARARSRRSARGV